MTTVLICLGYLISIPTLGIVIWSAIHPKRRVWPPRSFSRATLLWVWVPTLSLFTIVILLGVLDWNAAPLPDILRFGVGIPLIVLGNMAVWYEATKFGVKQTSGDEGTLRVKGLYRYSRNPQYVADVAIIMGWLLLSASVNAATVGLMVIAILLLAPFAEESWLKERYGDAYVRYASCVRRYL